MKGIEVPQTIEDNDDRSPHPERTEPNSMASSLRKLLTENDNHENGDDEDSDDDSFVFSDHMHHLHAAEIFSDTLRGFGLITDSNDGNGGDHEAKTEKTLLLNQRIEDGKSRATNERLKEKREERPTIPYRSESKLNAYNIGQKELFLEVLDKVDQIQNTTRKEKGFKEWKFTFGLVNCFLIAYVFGSHPEHFWILYAIETIFWMTYKFRGMYYAKPLSEVLYYLDFCWVVNTLGVTIIVTSIILDIFLTFDVIPIEVRKNIFLACFGVFCGPVFMAAMALPFVAFLFHDVNTMASLIIHLMPSMVMYHHRWHAAKIGNAYPNIFPYLAEYMDEVNSSENTTRLMRIALVVYFLWFVFYTTWMLLVGLKLPVISKDKGNPQPKYDTVFHTTWQGGMCEMVGTTVWKRSKEVSRDCSERNDYEVRDFLLYMVGHALCSCGLGIVLIAVTLCFSGGKIVHATLLWFTTILCAKRGADRYTYYVTSMYGQKLRKAFKELDHQHQGFEKRSNNNSQYGSIVEENKEITDTN